jgi:glutaredoxin 2
MHTNRLIFSIVKGAKKIAVVEVKGIHNKDMHIQSILGALHESNNMQYPHQSMCYMSSVSAKKEMPMLARCAIYLKR